LYFAPLKGRQSVTSFLVMLIPERKAILNTEDGEEF
jgi:hypothetical protein